jgi:carbamoyl-phosphate synthase small subunit
MTANAALILEDNTEIQAVSFGHPVSAAGEVVFNTGMVGYHETLTDPSYHGQILVMTYPLTGNYGVPEVNLDQFGLPVGFESRKIQVAGLVVSEHSSEFCHHAATRSLSQWLHDEGIPALYGVDTRALTKRLREKGSMLGKIELGEEPIGFFDPNATDLAGAVSVSEVIEHRLPDGRATDRPKRVVLLDCGCKANIIRSLLIRGLEVIQVPYNHYFMNLNFDGLVISNGPGDPKMYDATAQNVGRALALGKPMLGICLGHQILARAIGAETYKLKFGHRSHNQPCVEHPINGQDKPRRCYITSQNHGYAVRPEGLPRDWKIWFTNANDGTVEGIRHVTKPFASVQFHPEATPGPVDTAFLFDDFARQVNGQ